MAKEKEETKEEVFNLHPYIRDKFYVMEIDGTAFLVRPAVYFHTTAGREQLKPLACWQWKRGISNEIKSAEIEEVTTTVQPNRVEGFVNLTFKQKRELAHARVIRLSKEQGRLFNVELRDWYKAIQNRDEE